MCRMKLTEAQRLVAQGMYTFLWENINPDKVLKKRRRHKKWRLANAEHLRRYEQQRHARRMANPTTRIKKLAQIKKWQQANRDKVSASQRRRRKFRRRYIERWLKENVALKKYFDRVGYLKRVQHISADLIPEAIKVIELKQSIWKAKRVLAGVKPTFTKGKTDESNQKRRTEL